MKKLLSCCIIFLLFLTAVDVAHCADKPNKRDKEIDKLLEQRAAIELSLIRKRAEMMRKDSEVKRIHEKIMKLYAKLHKALEKNKDIRKLREELADIEEKIKEKRIGDDQDTAETSQENPDSGTD